MTDEDPWYGRRGFSILDYLKICLRCGKGFTRKQSHRSNSRFARQMYCGTICTNLARKFIYKIRFSEGMKSQNNPMWKGDEVGMIALHLWIRARLPEPKLCQVCNKRPPHDLAN